MKNIFEYIPENVKFSSTVSYFESYNKIIKRLRGFPHFLFINIVI